MGGDGAAGPPRGLLNPALHGPGERAEACEAAAHSSVPVPAGEDAAGARGPVDRATRGVGGGALRHSLSAPACHSAQRSVGAGTREHPHSSPPCWTNDSRERCARHGVAPCRGRPRTSEECWHGAPRTAPAPRSRRPGARTAMSAGVGSTGPYPPVRGHWEGARVEVVCRRVEPAGCPGGCGARSRPGVPMRLAAPTRQSSGGDAALLPWTSR